jgi:hypothetical protein
MQHSVYNAWIAWNTPFEGYVSWMYLDTEGYVTTGMGNKIDPIGLALALPWDRTRMGVPANLVAIRAEWTKIKAMISLAERGANAAEEYTTLRLSPAAIASLIDAKLIEYANTLKTYKSFAAFEAWPADAQLGLLSMAWAMGPNFEPKFPKFSAACAIQDWTTAANQCQMNDTPMPTARNAATKQAFLYAEQVYSANGDYSVLHSPVP